MTGINRQIAEQIDRLVRSDAREPSVATGVDGVDTDEQALLSTARVLADGLRPLRQARVGFQALLEERLGTDLRETPPHWWRHALTHAAGWCRHLSAPLTRGLRGAWAAPAGLVVMVALLLVTTGIIVAAPETRAQIRTMVTRSGLAGSRVTALYPVTVFTPLQPTYLPQGMQLVAHSYTPGSTTQGTLPSSPTLGSVASRIGGQDVDPALAQFVSIRARQLVGDGREAILVLIYASEADKLIELVERPASARPLPAGERTTVRGERAVLLRRDGRDVLAWTENGTYIELYTTLGRSEAARVAEALQPTTLAAPEAGAGTDVAVVPVPTSASLSQRALVVAVPDTSEDALRRRCGSWRPSLYRADPPAGYQLTLCVARAVAGVDESSSASLSRHTWNEVSQWLRGDSIDQIAKLAGTTTVWMVQLEVSDTGGKIVVLDTETGRPYLLAELKPVKSS